MKRKKFSRVLWGGIIFLLFYICYVQMERNELSNVYIVQLFSIDKISSGYQVTALYDSNGGDSSSGVEALDGVGESVYLAYEDLQRKNNREMSIANTSYYLISDQIARENLETCLDFISREQSVKNNAALYVLRTDNMKDTITKAIEDKIYFHDAIEAINQKQSDDIKHMDNTILSIHNKIEQKSKNLIIPYLLYKDKLLYSNGYATFKNNSLFVYLDYQTSQAIDLFRNRLVTYPLMLDTVGIELSNIRVATTANFMNDRLQVVSNFKSNGEIKEVTSNTNVFDETQLAQIESQANQKLYSSFFKIITFMKANDIDLLNFEDLAGLSLPGNEDVLKNMVFELTVQTDLAKNYLLEN